MIDLTTAPYAVLLLRLCLGAMFIAHAMLKVRVFTIPGTVAFFQSLGLPGWFAYPTIAAELGGAACLQQQGWGLGIPRVLDGCLGGRVSPGRRKGNVARVSSAAVTTRSRSRMAAIAVGAFTVVDP
jgi:DoxX